MKVAAKTSTGGSDTEDPVALVFLPVIGKRKKTTTNGNGPFVEDSLVESKVATGFALSLCRTGAMVIAALGLMPRTKQSWLQVLVTLPTSNGDRLKTLDPFSSR